MKLTNKQWAIVAVVAVIAIVGGFFIFNKVNNTPERKVAKLEKTLAERKEKSGFNACMDKVNAKIKGKEDCLRAKLVEQGYTDGIDCMENFNDPVCEEMARYNAEVDASNECRETYKGDTLNMFNCMELLSEK